MCLKPHSSSMNKFPLLPVLPVVLASCTIIRPGQVGVKQTLGKLSETTHTRDAVWFNPFVAKVIKADVQVDDLELALNLPSKEGLSVLAQISILYRIDPEQMQTFIQNMGFQHKGIIANVFRSASADICSQYYAKDMHSGMRAEIEASILAKMDELLRRQGILIDAVLMKSIQLPEGLASSIERKLQAEQDVMRMEFVLQQESLEAERKIIEATGAKDAQIILTEGLTEEIIRMRGIEAFLELAQSNNSKVIITDGKSPLLVD